MIINKYYNTYLEMPFLRLLKVLLLKVDLIYIKFSQVSTVCFEYEKSV